MASGKDEDIQASDDKPFAVLRRLFTLAVEWELLEKSARVEGYLTGFGASARRSAMLLFARTSSTTCLTAVTMESGDSAMLWSAFTITCRPRADKCTRLACNW